MLAYAASRPVAAERRSSPTSMLFIGTAHIVALAALIAARPDLVPAIKFGETKVVFVPIDPVPPEPKPTVDAPHPGPSIPTPATTLVTAPDPVVDVPDTAPVIGGSVDPQPLDPGIVEPIKPLPKGKTGPAISLTPADQLRPPYPPSKLASGSEADLKLRLTIDRTGAVVGVEPIGRADAVFLAAARRHLMKAWHYQPAMEDGEAVMSRIVVTLHFQLDG